MQRTHKYDNFYYLDRNMLETAGACTTALNSIGDFLGAPIGSDWSTPITLELLRKYHAAYTRNAYDMHNLNALVYRIDEGPLERGIPDAAIEAWKRSKYLPIDFMNIIVAALVEEDRDGQILSKEEVLEEAEHLGFIIEDFEGGDVLMSRGAYIKMRRKLYTQGFKLQI